MSIPSGSLLALAVRTAEEYKRDTASKMIWAARAYSAIRNLTLMQNKIAPPQDNELLGSMQPVWKWRIPPPVTRSSSPYRRVAQRSSSRSRLMHLAIRNWHGEL